MGRLVRSLNGRGEGLSYRFPASSCRVRSRASREQKTSSCVMTQISTPENMLLDDAASHDPGRSPSCSIWSTALVTGATLVLSICA